MVAVGLRSGLNRLTPTVPPQANIMNILGIFVSVMFFPSGLLFDAVGGRVTGVLGCVVLFSGLWRDT